MLSFHVQLIEIDFKTRNGCIKDMLSKMMLIISILLSLQALYKSIKIIYMYSRMTRKGANEPRHDKINKVTVCSAKTQVSLGICRLIRVFNVHLMGS